MPVIFQDGEPMFLLSTRSIPDDLSEDRLTEFILIEDKTQQGRRRLHGTQAFTYNKKKDTKVCAYLVCSVRSVYGKCHATVIQGGVAYFAWDGICTPTQSGLIAIEDKDTSSSEEESRIGG